MSRVPSYADRDRKEDDISDLSFTRMILALFLTIQAFAVVFFLASNYLSGVLSWIALVLAISCVLFVLFVLLKRVTKNL